MRRTIPAWFRINVSLQVFTAPYGSVLSFFTLGRKASSSLFCPDHVDFSLCSIWNCTLSHPKSCRFLRHTSCHSQASRESVFTQQHGQRGRRGLIFWSVNHEKKTHWLACDCRFVYRRKCHREYVRIKYLYGRAEASAVAANKWNEAWVWETRGDTGNKRKAGTIERGRYADCHFWPPHHTSTFTIDCIRPAKQPRHIRQETDSG